MLFAATNISFGSLGRMAMAIAWHDCRFIKATFVPSNPTVTSTQFVPPFVDLKTPLIPLLVMLQPFSETNAMTFGWSRQMAMRARPKLPAGIGMVRGVQFAPPSVDL